MSDNKLTELGDRTLKIKRLTLAEIKHYLDFQPEQLKVWGITIEVLLDTLLELQDSSEVTYSEQEYEELEKEVEEAEDDKEEAEELASDYRNALRDVRDRVNDIMGADE